MHMIGQLESRENELFYENRELRDLVSVLASRMFRFAHYLRRRPCDEKETDDETSLDGDSADADQEGDVVIDYCSSSSDEG